MTNHKQSGQRVTSWNIQIATNVRLYYAGTKKKLMSHNIDLTTIIIIILKFLQFCTANLMAVSVSNEGSLLYSWNKCILWIHFIKLRIYRMARTIHSPDRIENSSHRTEQWPHAKLDVCGCHIAMGCACACAVHYTTKLKAKFVFKGLRQWPGRKVIHPKPTRAHTYMYRKRKV